MTHRFDDELAEQYRAEKYREASARQAELEQERLNKIFATLGSVEKHVSLSFTGEELTLGKVRSDVEAGDRSAMLELLGIVADSLRWFDALPQQTREALADGLEKMRNNLEEAKGFLPRGRGERRKSDTRRHATAEFFTAFAVEHARRVEGLSLEDAIAKVVDESGMTDSLVLKRWKRRHKAAKESLDTVDGVMGSVGVPMPEKLRRIKRRP